MMILPGFPKIHHDLYERDRPVCQADLLQRETEARPNPSVVFLVGQSGAGKSKVTEMIAGVLNRRGGFIDIDSDLYKPYHPKYDELMAQDDTLMAAYTRADGRAWMAQAEGYVRENRLN